MTDFEIHVRCIKEMTPSAREPCLREMRDEGLISEKEYELLLKVARGEEIPS
jgi:hypothetical protein